MGRAMQEQDYQDHKRTVNKVNFHATEPFKLISGSQDGTMRYFDVRVKNAVSVFYRSVSSLFMMATCLSLQINFAAILKVSETFSSVHTIPTRFLPYRKMAMYKFGMSGNLTSFSNSSPRTVDLCLLAIGTRNPRG